MYINNLSNEDEQYIDNILTNGLEEMKEISLIDSKQSQLNNMKGSTQLQMDIGDLNKINLSENYQKTQISKKPKSSALKNLINQLKQTNEYTFSSDEEGKITKDIISLGNESKGKKILPSFTEKKDINMNLNIKKVDINSRNFIELKDEMISIRDKIDSFNKRISKSVNKIIYTPFKDSKTKKQKQNHNEENERKLYSDKTTIKRSKSKSKISSQNSSYLLNSSFSNSNIKVNRGYSPSPRSSNSHSLSYKSKYYELKEKLEMQREKISAEKASISSLEVKLKRVTKKNKNYKKLVEYNKQLFNQEELLKKQLRESDSIRKEQSKLIRSLQREIDILRGDIDSNNLNNLAEIYQEMKESLLKSNSQSQN